jgi:hypothetical protein
LLYNFNSIIETGTAKYANILLIRKSRNECHWHTYQEYRAFLPFEKSHQLAGISPMTTKALEIVQINDEK